MKALLIEGDRIARIALFYMLNNFGFQVEVAADGTTALELLKKNTYELVLTDIDLPDISGIEVINQFRCYNKTTKVIIQSARLDRKLMKDCFSAGCNSVLGKPLTSEILRAHL